VGANAKRHFQRALAFMVVALDTGNVKVPRGECAAVAFTALALTGCSGGSGPQVMKLRNDTSSTVQVARCRANQCAPSRDLVARATLTVQMQRLAQGSAPEYLSIQAGAGGSRCILIPPATTATVGKTFYVTVSDVTATDCG
jgi:hypothetical protein